MELVSEFKFLKILCGFIQGFVDFVNFGTVADRDGCLASCFTSYNARYGTSPLVSRCPFGGEVLLYISRKYKNVDRMYGAERTGVT